MSGATTFRILGPIEAWEADRRVSLGGPRQVSLLAFFLMNANRAVSTDLLSDALWGSERSGTAKRLQMAVVRLRRAIEPSRGEREPILRTVTGGYLFSVAPGALDTDVFSERLREGQLALREHDPARAADVLRAALALWRGPALAEVRFADFAQPEIRRLEESRLVALESRIGADLELGRHAQIVGELQGLVAEHPTRERLAAQLMLALYRSGRQADALESYEMARIRLAEQLGLEPGPLLKSLQTEILGQDPGLMPAIVSSSGTGGAPPDGPQRVQPGPAEAASGASWQRGVPVPPRALPHGPSRFVDRETERKVLTDALSEAAAASRRAVFVTGEAGIGKTRLASEIARTAHESGVLVLAGRCDEELSVPYQPFAEALEQLVEHAPERLLTAHLAEYGDSLARLVPALAVRGGRTPTAWQAPSESERYVLFQAIEGLLRTTCAGAAVLIVLEDLHWADVPTLKLLRSLLTSPRTLAVMVLCTCRVAELPTDHALRTLLADLHREPHVARLDLRGLAVPHVRALIDAVVDEPAAVADDRLARALEANTSGNPFFITELVRSLAETDGLLFEDGRPERGPGDVLTMELPVSISETLAARVRRLSEDVRRCLRVASVIGNEFDLHLVSALAVGFSAADALEQAVDAGLLLEMPGAPARLRFSHALMQRYLYGQLGPARREELHRQVALGLERVGAARAAGVAEVARHWLAAGAVDPRQPLRYAALAGDDALRQLAPDEARRWYEIALTQLDRAGDGHDALRCDLLVRRGEAERQAGEPRFRETLLHAAELARRIGADDSLVRAALANTRGMQSATGVVDEARIATLEAALRVVGQTDSPARARLLAQQAAELMYSQQWERRVRLSDEALAIGRRLDDPDALSAVLNMRFVTLLAPETLVERMGNTLEAVAVVDRLSDPLARFYAYHWRFYACLEAGDVAAARSWAARERDIADQFRQPTTVWLATADEANLSIVSGQLNTADELAGRAFELGKPSEPDALACYVAQTASVAFEAGRLGEMATPLQEAVAEYPGVPGFRAVVALALSESGRLDEAGMLFEESAAARFGDLPHDVTWLSVICIYALLASRLRDEAAVQTLYGLLERWRDQIAFPAFGVWGPVSLYLGSLALTMGDHASAEHQLSEAASVAARMTAPHWEARARSQLAQLTSVNR
ncbi:MAG TPA: BTAD domain-containing putative transcriptional regulator [Solirubrobacteraceae bacterium]